MIRHPRFSIVIPVLDRRIEVCRAIDSCLAQEFDAFEVIVVNDGSQDGTGEAVAGYSDPRIRLIEHETNRGMWHARISGVRVARGEWVIFLDSDDELLAGCLTRIHREIALDDRSVDRFGFQYQYDTGQVSPMPPEPIIGYAEWLRWIDRSPMTDALWVIRHSCFTLRPLPVHFEPDLSYGLEFARHFRTLMVPAIVALVHTDCPVRLSHLAPGNDPAVVKRKAEDRAAEWRYVLAEHGEALRSLAPRQYERVVRGAALSNLLAGNRFSAVRSSLAALRFRPASLSAWITMLLVIAGPRITLLFNRLRARLRRRHEGGALCPVRRNLSQSRPDKEKFGANERIRA